MPVIADTHVHIYPCYDLTAVIRNAMQNLDTLASDSQSATGAREGWERVLFLTERHDCHMFRQCRDQGIDLGSLEGQCRMTRDEQALVVEVLGTGTIFLIAGRQVVTEEGIEIAALAVEADIPDGLALDEVIRQIDKANGITVLPWAPGKWFFKRGNVVEKLIEKTKPGRLILGDTTLRPTIWPEPSLMVRGREKGLGIVAGSDPLPVPGEEVFVGSYGVVLEGAFDADRPVRSLRQMMYAPSAPFTVIGKRGGLPEVCRRLWQNAKSKKDRT